MQIEYSFFEENPEPSNGLNCILQMMVLNEIILNKILPESQKNNLMFNYLQDTMVDYINKIGTKNLVNFRDLRTRIKHVTNGAKLNPNKTLECIVKNLDPTLDLGFNFTVKKQISCSCSAFYGKTLTAYGFFNINSKDFLDKYSKAAIQEYFQQLEVPLNFPLETILRCPDIKCKQKILKEFYDFDSEPLNFIINLNWDSKPEPLEILKILVAIQPNVNLKSKLNSTQGRNFSVRGLILQKSSGEFVYCTTLNSEFYVIEDSKFFKVVGGDWLDSIYNFAIHSYMPIILLYSASDTPFFKSIELDDLETLETITASQTGVYKDWLCICCGAENLAEDEACRVCKIRKQSDVKDWECKCGFINPGLATVCTFCCMFRFDYNTGKCGVCNKEKKGKECINCNKFKCTHFKCLRIIFFGQKMYHFKCGNICSGYCKACNEVLNTSNALCFICFEQEFHFCKLCKKMHYKTLNCEFKPRFWCSMCFQIFQSFNAYCKNCRYSIKLREKCSLCYSSIQDILLCNDCFTALNN